MAVYNERGRYRVAIIGADLTQAKSGTDQVLLALELQGVYAANGELCQCPQPMYPPEVYLALTEATMGDPHSPGWVAQTLSYLGFTGDFDRLSDLVGKVTDAICDHEPNQNNELAERWKIVRPGGKRQTAPPDRKAVRRLSTQWGSLFAQATSGTQATQAVQPAPTTQVRPQPARQSQGQPPTRPTQARQPTPTRRPEPEWVQEGDGSQTTEDIPF